MGGCDLAAIGLRNINLDVPLFSTVGNLGGNNLNRAVFVFDPQDEQLLISVAYLTAKARIASDTFHSNLKGMVQ